MKDLFYFFWLGVRFLVQFTVLYIVADTVYLYIVTPRKKPHKNNFRYYNGIIYNTFVLIPKRLCEYLQYVSSKEFNQSGLILYCGAQGEGKTYAMCHEVTKILCNYPDSKIFCNIWFAPADGRLDTWQPLIYEKNGENGIIFMFDEISLHWNSRFRDLPPDVLQELVQNRKNHRVIFGTCQSISMCDKQVRLQATEYRNAHCFFGAFIVCTCWRPVFDFNGDLSDKHFLGFKFYIQDDVIRASYDTFELVSRLAKLGFNYEKPQEISINMKGATDGKKKKVV